MNKWLGKCAICFREIAEMTPWNNKKCADGSFHPVHQSCLDAENKPKPKLLTPEQIKGLNLMEHEHGQEFLASVTGLIPSGSHGLRSVPSTAEPETTTNSGPPPAEPETSPPEISTPATAPPDEPSSSPIPTPSPDGVTSPPTTTAGEPSPTPSQPDPVLSSTSGPGPSTASASSRPAATAKPPAKKAPAKAPTKKES